MAKPLYTTLQTAIVGTVVICNTQCPTKVFQCFTCCGTVFVRPLWLQFCKNVVDMYTSVPQYVQVNIFHV